MLVEFDFPTYDRTLDLTVEPFAPSLFSLPFGFFRRQLPPTRVLVVRSLLFFSGRALRACHGRRPCAARRIGRRLDHLEQQPRFHAHDRGTLRRATNRGHLHRRHSVRMRHLGTPSSNLPRPRPRLPAMRSGLVDEIRSDLTHSFAVFHMRKQR